jgi:diguanylate cyclase (GGDEF)-like protein/PAS domain S-box-containing protein
MRDPAANCQDCGVEGPESLSVFDDLPDVVVAFDSSLTIKYVNRFARRLMGHEDTPLADQNLVEFVHPDDLGRAAEVAGLISDGTLKTQITPAIYRLQDSKGEWWPIEINGTPKFVGGALDDLIVIVGRYSGDHDLQDRILRMLSSGVPTDEIVALIPEFGLWRHPEAQYAVEYVDSRGYRSQLGSKGALDLLERFDQPDAPWNLVRVAGDEVRNEWGELPDELRAAASELGMHGVMVLPVIDPLSDELALVIGWASRPDQDVGAHRYALERMARSLDIILQWRAHLTALERAAQIDALSGVANRAAFFAQFKSALASPPDDGGDAHVAVLYVDLDRFKQVNDTAGHAMGDAVIVGAAERMSKVVRHTDLVARLGGDEFAVLCTGVTSIDEVTSMAARIVEALAEPFEHQGLAVSIGASVGVAVSRQDDIDHDALLADADAALYRAKADGRGRWCLAHG